MSAMKNVELTIIKLRDKHLKVRKAEQKHKKNYLSKKWIINYEI